MFVRWRQRPSGRLSARLVENQRADDRVLQQHIAELGAIAGEALAQPHEIAGIKGRRAFWATANATLARLSNRIDVAADGAARAALHARVPMVTPDELALLALDEAEHDAALWQHQSDGAHDIVAARQRLIEAAQRALADDQAIAAADDVRAAAAKARLERARAGEILEPTFAIGLDHFHIWGQLELLRRAGAELAASHAAEHGLAKPFAERVPGGETRR